MKTSGNITNFAAPILRESREYFPRSNNNTLLDIFNYVYAVLGIIAVIMVVYAGIQMVISQGNSEKVATARRTVIYSIVGLIIIILSGTIVNFFVNRLSA